MKISETEQRELEAKIASKFTHSGDKFMDWLTELIDFDYGDFDGGIVNQPRWWRLSYLLCRNYGSWEVHGYGITSSGGLFGCGLHESEAVELTSFYNAFGGVNLALDYDAFHEFKPVFEEFVRVIVEIKEKEMQCTETQT